MIRSCVKAVSSASEHRGRRLKIAFALEGRGTATKKAAEWDTSIEHLSRVAMGRRNSYRLETLIDAYIRDTFAKHRPVLDLEAV